jgi:hypothetical protein
MKTSVARADWVTRTNPRTRAKDDKLMRGFMKILQEKGLSFANRSGS